MKNRDNQQERLLCWLGGIIDGEGCITINHNRLHRGTKRETLLFKPLIDIANTNKILIDTCQEVLRDNNIPFWVSYTAKNQRQFNRKENWHIRIEGIKRCIKALNIIIPYLIAKKTEANLVKEFCERRLCENKGNNKVKEYKDKDFELIYKVAKIHNRNPQRLYAEIREYQKQDRSIKKDSLGRYVAKQDIV